MRRWRTVRALPMVSVTAQEPVGHARENLDHLIGYSLTADKANGRKDLLGLHAPTPRVPLNVIEFGGRGG